MERNTPGRTRRQTRAQKARKAVGRYEWLEMFALALVVVVFLFSFIFRVVTISGPSMNSTLWDGERVIVSKFLYTPKVGDVIVFSLPGEKDPYIKRVIALEGQTVDFDPLTATLMVDGKTVAEPYINEPMNDMPLWYTGNFPLTVPEDQIFVMGDNRNHSYDSRRFGCISTEIIVGRAYFIIFPFDKAGKIV